MKFARLLLSTSFVAFSANYAQAFEFSVKSSVPDQEFSRACQEALTGLNAPKMVNFCRTKSVQNLLTDVENSGYEQMADANELMPLHSYYQKHGRVYNSHATSPDAVRARNEWKANGLSGKEGYWLAAPAGKYIDLNNLSRLSIKAELVRVDFGTSSERKNDSYTRESMSFTFGQQSYTYQAWKFGADLHYRYTVKWDGRTIYDGFIKTHQNLAKGKVCPTNNPKAREDCLGIIGAGGAGENFFTPFVASKSWAGALLVRDNSPLSEMSAYYYGDKLDPNKGAQFGGSSNIKTAQRPDIASYAGSFQVIEGGRATFAYKQLPLYTAAQQNAPATPTGGGSANTAKFLADQQHCAQVAKKTMAENRAFGTGLSWIASAAGYGGVANKISAANSFAAVADGLNGEELNIANRCMRNRGHTSIEDATAMDAAEGASTSTYVPYTGGASAPQHVAAPAPTYQGSASAYASAPHPTPSYQGSASAYGNAPSTYAPATQPAPQQHAALSGSASAYAQQPAPESKNSRQVNAWPTQTRQVPPTMPRKAQVSGYCLVEWDVSSAGTPLNVRADNCSEDIFREPSLQAAQQFRFATETQEPGKIRTGLQSLIKFKLTDHNGNLLAPPNGYWGPTVTPPTMSAPQSDLVAAVPQPATVLQPVATPNYDNPAQFAQAPAPVATSEAPAATGNKVGRIMLVDTDFGFATAQATGLQIGDVVHTQTPSGQVISFTVAKQSSDGNYSLIPNNGASMDDLQPGYPLMK